MSAFERLPKPLWKALRVPKEDSWGCFCCQNPVKKLIHNFGHFSSLSWRSLEGATPSLRPDPPPAASVLATFRPGSVKIQCVFWYFAKRRFWHPVYFLFLWFSLSLLRRGDAAGSKGLRHSADPLEFRIGGEGGPRRWLVWGGVAWKGKECFRVKWCGLG